MNFHTRTAVLPRRTGLAGRVAAAVIAAAVAVLLVPSAAFAQTQYTIRSGDTLAGIAAASGSSVQAIADANGIADVDLIIAGASLTIPGDGSSAPAADDAPAAAPQEAPAPAPEPEPAPAVASGGVWDRLAQCESGGNWAINTGNGYYGGLQFSESSWHAVGGSGLPHQHSRDTQIAMAERLLDAQGWGAWPACSAKLGLR